MYPACNHVPRPACSDLHARTPGDHRALRVASLWLFRASRKTRPPSRPATTRSPATLRPAATACNRLQPRVSIKLLAQDVTLP